MHQRSTLPLSLLSFLLPLGGCKILSGLPAKPQKNTVVVIGTVHEDHLDSESYALENVEELLRRIDPQLVLCEIPPDRFEAAWESFIREGEVSEPLVVKYPEFSEVLFPMALEGRFQVVPCSAWTASMDELRRLSLDQWSHTRIDDTRVVTDAREKGEQTLEKEGLLDAPLAMHTERFDVIVAEAMQPYERLFSRDLGEGGWTQINQAHYALISEALDEIKGNGWRVVVMFGSWHKYRLRELLAERDDIELLRLTEVVE